MKNHFCASVVLLSALLLAAPHDVHAEEKAFRAGPQTVALWNFGGTSSEGAVDEGYSGINLVPWTGENLEPPQVVEGKVGSALFFPGNAALIRSTGGGEIETPDKVTLEVWMKLDPAGGHTTRGIFQYMRYQECGFRMGGNPSHPHLERCAHEF